jgi:hypothetical protein
MFDTEAHRPYIDLCRGLRLEREFAVGDYCSALGGGAPWGPGLWDWETGVDRTGLDRRGLTWIWLPRLDQWLSMLEEAGEDSVTLETTRSPGLYRAWNGIGDDEAIDGRAGAGRTREEAAAKLWCAVTGRAVTA